MQLTIFTDYGLRCLMYLAVRPEDRISVKQISDYYNISRNHLVKVVHKLSQMGYVDSYKGRGGGLQLSQDPKDIRLGDLVLDLEPNMHIVECFDVENNRCRITENCQLKHVLREAEQAFITVLNGYNVQDIVTQKKLFADLLGGNP